MRFDPDLTPPYSRTSPSSTIRAATPAHALIGAWVTALALLPSFAAGQTVEREEAESHLEAEQEEGEEHHSIAGRHRITLGLGHTHLSEAGPDGGKEWIVAASWALNYDYWLTERWAIGLQNDLIIEEFVIEHGDEEFIERERPLAVIPSVLYKPLKWLTLIAGVGREFTSAEDLTLTRFGAEAGWHVHPDWEVGGAVIWDVKWGFYNSWGLDFSVSRFLGSGR
jgi:hypothetical protein